jgi:putative ABC transport system permease protein
LGLAVGMACCFLIMLYVRFELSYEDFHANKNFWMKISTVCTNPSRN